jgi:hypothetical protein
MRRVWALVQLRPQTHHHPDLPAAHTAFQTHGLGTGWARLVSEQYGPSIAPHCFARARCPVPIFTTFRLRFYLLFGDEHILFGDKAIFPRRGSARVTGHTRANFCVSDLAVVS